MRVLGRCGGDFSDILDGMAWAAGIPVPGVPANPHPAKVINLSVGGQGPCVSQIQAIVDEILDAGVFIAVAAGNDNANADDYVPASCGGLTTVGATDSLGARASYSNFSTGMDISAPGGDRDRNGTTRLHRHHLEHRHDGRGRAPHTPTPTARASRRRRSPASRH